MQRFPIPILLVKGASKIEAAAAEEGREPGGKTDDKPLLEVKRSKENRYHLLIRFAKGSEDFDAWFVRIHVRFQSGSRLRGKPDGCNCVLAWPAFGLVA